MPEDEIILAGNTQELMPLIKQIMAFRQIAGGAGQFDFYGIPVTTFQDQFRFAPQCKLVFYQTAAEAGDNKPVYGEVSFRIESETEKSYNEAKAKALAEKIKSKFVTPLFTWRKGKVIASYLDKVKGYDFRLRVLDEGEARKLIEQVMDLQNHSPDWERLTMHFSKNTFPENPDKEMIYGEMRKLPRRRPVEDIKFRYAELHIHGIPQAITLIDTTGRRGSPLISAI